MRVGLGYDVHRLVENRDLILGGVKIPFELEDYETLHGYLTALLGKIPSEDEEFSVEGNGCRFDVLSVNNKMIEKVRVTKLPEKDGDETQSCQKEEKMVE